MSIQINSVASFEYKFWKINLRLSKEKILQLRWNFEEFEAHLKRVSEMIPVGNYYLKLLVHLPEDRNTKPSMTEERVSHLPSLSPIIPYILYRATETLTNSFAIIK